MGEQPAEVFVKSVSAITIQSGVNKDSYGIQPHWQTEEMAANEFVRDISSISEDVLADEEMQIVDHFFEGGVDFENDEENENPSEQDSAGVVAGMYVARELPDVCLKGMFMEGADFASAHLHRADFSRANLRMADFSSASLNSANLNQANLTFADFRNADLQDTDFRNAELCKADLRGADLRGAQMGGANFQFADLSATDLRGADLNAANLKGSILKGACFDSTTILPISLEQARELGMVAGVTVERDSVSLFQN